MFNKIIFKKISFGLNIIIAFPLSYHFELFKFLFLTIFAFFSFLLWVLERWACLLLGLGGLWNLLCASIHWLGLLLLYLNLEEVDDWWFFGKLWLFKDELYFRVDLPVIYQQICAFTGLLLFPLKIILKRHRSSSKTLSLNTVDTEQTHQWIIKLQPPVILRLYIWYVMSRLCITDMYNYACKLIFELVQILGMLLRGLFSIKML